MTFLEMQQRVGELINQDVSTDNLLVTKTEVKANINRAYQKLVNRLVSLGQDYYVRLAKANLVGGQNLYGLPVDFRKMIRVEIAPEDEGTRYKAHRLDSNAFGDPVDTNIAPTTPVYSIRGKNIDLKPTPTSNVTRGLWMWYVENVSDLVQDDDEPNIPLEFGDLTIEYAAAKAKARKGLFDEASFLMAEFERGIEKMTDELVNANSDDPEQVVIRDTYFD